MSVSGPKRYMLRTHSRRSSQSSARGQQHRRLRRLRVNVGPIRRLRQAELTSGMQVPSGSLDRDSVVRNSPAKPSAWSARSNDYLTKSLLTSIRRSNKGCWCSTLKVKQSGQPVMSAIPSSHDLAHNSCPRYKRNRHP